MKKLTLQDEEYKKSVQEVIDYLNDNHDLLLGQFEAEHFLDELVKNLAPRFYNQGLDAALGVIQSNLLTVEELLDLEKVL